MLEFLQSLDKTVFLFINVQMANPVTDFVMPVVTADNLLRVVYGVAVLLLLWKGDFQLRWLVLASILTLVLTDQLSSGLFKPLLNRPRPCHVMENINLLVGCGAGQAMPSSHAANAFGQAVLFSIFYRKPRLYLLSFAALVAVSRIFVGVHYFGDIIAGAVLGGLCAAAAAALYRFAARGRLSSTKRRL